MRNNMSEEVQTNPIEDLVQNALDQDFNKANQIFGDLMGAKISDALDAEKVKLADQLYNGVEAEEEPDEEQLELDLEDEEEVDADESEEDEDEELVITDDDFEEEDTEEEN
jgi:hypothetical protein